MAILKGVVADGDQLIREDEAIERDAVLEGARADGNEIGGERDRHERAAILEESGLEGFHGIGKSDVLHGAETRKHRCAVDIIDLLAVDLLGDVDHLVICITDVIFDGVDLDRTVIGLFKVKAEDGGAAVVADAVLLEILVHVGRRGTKGGKVSLDGFFLRAEGDVHRIVEDLIAERGRNAEEVGFVQIGTAAERHLLDGLQGGGEDHVGEILPVRESHLADASQSIGEDHRAEAESREGVRPDRRDPSAVDILRDHEGLIVIKVGILGIVPHERFDIRSLDARDHDGILFVIEVEGLKDRSIRRFFELILDARSSSEAVVDVMSVRRGGIDDQILIDTLKHAGADTRCIVDILKEGNGEEVCRVIECIRLDVAGISIHVHLHFAPRRHVGIQRLEVSGIQRTAVDREVGIGRGLHEGARSIVVIEGDIVELGGAFEGALADLLYRHGEIDLDHGIIIRKGVVRDGRHRLAVDGLGDH